jgi:hypothetical protein
MLYLLRTLSISVYLYLYLYVYIYSMYAFYVVSHYNILYGKGTTVLRRQERGESAAQRRALVVDRRCMSSDTAAADRNHSLSRETEQCRA